MEKQDFKNFVVELARYYDKKDFLIKSSDNQGRLSSWFYKVHDLPGGQVLKDIYARITDEYERFPPNLPKVMRACWNVWRNENPDKVIRMRQKADGCRYCDRGWINYSAPDEKSGITYEYTCVCGHCRSAQGSKIPMLTTQEIEEQGGTVICRKSRPGKDRPIYNSLSEMTDAVGNRHDDEVPF